MPRAYDPLPRLRTICLALPGAEQFVNHGYPCFQVRKKTFVMYLVNHHNDGRIAIWCKAPPGAQHSLVDSDPARFFVPPYVGPKGWIGIRLEKHLVDWPAVSSLVTESFQMTAPKRQK
jgi:hypothetical protein